MDWPYAYTPYIWTMLASAVFMAVLAAYAWKHRMAPGAAPLAVQMLLGAVWALFTAVEIATTSEAGKMFWNRLGLILSPLAVTALLVFALEYANPSQRTTRRTIAGLWGLALFVGALLATNNLHHLIWVRLWFDGFVRVERGPWGLAIVGYSLILPALALVIFLRVAWRSQGIYRTQALLLFVGIALPVLASLLEPAGINPVAPLNPMILMLNVTGMLFMLAIYRYGMLGVIPIGRDTTFEHMVNAVLILDAEDNLVDCNLAAGALLALSRRASIGRPAEQALAAHPDLVHLLKQEVHEDAELSLDGAGQSQCFHVQISPLNDRRGFKLGRLIWLRDVTEQKRTRELLLQQQRTLAVMQERERLARELHDGLGQILAATHLQASTAKRLMAQGANDQTSECLDQLVEMTLEAEADVRDYLLGAKTAFSPGRPFFAALRQYLARFSQQYGLPAELTVPPELEEQGLASAVEVQLLRVIQEALSNVRKHARAHCATVSFTVVGRLVRILISDDGQGFDPAAVDSEGTGFGLRSMRDRAEAVGGSLVVTSSPGQGTQVSVLVPRS